MRQEDARKSLTVGKFPPRFNSHGDQLLCFSMLSLTRRITVVCILLIAAAARGDTYVYPEIVDLPNDVCEIVNTDLKELAERWTDREAGRLGEAKASSIDLNDDGICEILIDVPAIYEGNGNYRTVIMMYTSDRYKSVGDLQWDPKKWWYGEYKNGYPRIFVSTYTGWRSSPIYVTDVYVFDGYEYVLEFDSEFSHGRYMELGLNAYQRKDYITAELFYLNAYKMNKEERIQDANNLAITWIRLKKYAEAEELLEKHIADSWDKKYLAAAHYNLGLIYEKTKNHEKALEHFTTSNQLAPAKARNKKMESMRKKASRPS